MTIITQKTEEYTPSTPQNPPENGGGGGGAAPLDIHGNIAAPQNCRFGDGEGINPKLGSRHNSAARYENRFALLNTSRRLLPHFAVSKCLRFPTGAGVDVRYAEERARFGQLQTCKSVHVCPICGQTIAGHRKDEIATAIERWQERGGAVTMATFTLQHNAQQPLADVAGKLARAYRSLKDGKRWQTFKAGSALVGSIAATEYTYGLNGWHPHKHVLFLTDKPMSIQHMMWLKERWCAVVARAGGVAVKQACDVRPISAGGSGIGGYVAKNDWGAAHELALSPRKRSRADGGITPMGMLVDVASTGNAHSGARFVEYAEWTYRKNHIVWSRGLKARLGIDDQTDDEIVEEFTHEAEIVTRFERGAWYVILANEARHMVLATVEADDGALGLLNDYLALLGLPPQHPFIPPRSDYDAGAGDGSGFWRAGTLVVIQQMVLFELPARVSHWNQREKPPRYAPKRGAGWWRLQIGVFFP